MINNEMALIRFVIGLLGVLLGTYTLYAVVIAVGHGTNPAWVVFMALLVGTLSAFLIKAALDRPPERISAAGQIGTVLMAAAAGAVRGYQVGHMPGLIICTIISSLAASLYLLAGAERAVND
jgi:hypothetical protein